jgi:hypothetical protein
MRLDRRYVALSGQAFCIRRRLALLLAVIFALTLLAALQPADTVMGPSSAAAHDCNNNCFAGKFYETLSGCRRAGERALRADPYPNLDWEHYHCVRLDTREGPVYRLFLYDLGAPG